MSGHNAYNFDLAQSYNYEKPDSASGPESDLAGNTATTSTCHVHAVAY